MAAPRPQPPAGRLGPIHLAAVPAAVAAYLFGLGGPLLPSIGDEPLYLQIARVTGASGRWLPLRAEAGILDTKPPLLFWTALAATAGGEAWELWRLRLPVVLLTFATAALAGWLAARLARRADAGWVAALAFLGYRATMQHGRPFLTNAGETLFLFLPVVLLHGRRRAGPALTLACGLSLGAAALFKSFFLVAPATLATGLLLWRRHGDRRTFLAAHGPFLAGAAAIGLLAFALWPLLDPRPDLVLSQFVLGENAAKFRPAAFLSGLVSGPYPLWRIWLGPLLNAGLLAPPLVALGLDAWRRRRALPGEEAELWWWVLGFLLVYSLPTQRQENYLLPAGAALAVLLGVRWPALAAWSWRLPLAVLGAAALAAPVLVQAVGRAAGAPLHPPWLPVAAVALGAAALVGAAWTPSGRWALPPLAVLALPVATAFLAPFGAPFSREAAAAVAGRTVAAPDRFSQDQELLRFRLPGAALAGYRCPAGPAACAPPAGAAAGPALAFLDLGRAAPAGYEPVAEVPALKVRHAPAEVARLLGGDLSLLLERLVLLRPAPRPAADERPPAAPAAACPAPDHAPAADWPTAPEASVPPRAAAVAALERYAFTLDGPDEARRGVRTDALLVVHRGVVTYERYARGDGPATPHLLWSVAKSATSVLAGVAAAEGAVSPDDSVCRHLRAPPERCGITVRHLLESSSGLDWAERYEGQALQASSVLAMLYGEGRRDMAAFVLGHPARAAPGARWAYASGDALLLAAVLEAAMAPRHGAGWAHARLFDRLGMASAVLERDAAGTPVGSSWLHATPRDLARLGLLALADGCWRGERLLPPGWMAASTAVSPPLRAGSPDRGPGDVQGWGWWLNRPMPELGQPVPWPGVPVDAFSARGHWGQLLVVIPSLELVVVRTGDDREPGALDADRLVALAIAAGRLP